MTDKTYLLSSFLMYRAFLKSDGSYFNPLPREWDDLRTPIHDSDELERYLRKSVEKTCKGQKAALALSGGIDSAILAKFLPKGSIAYTFKCIVPGVDVVDETHVAAEYAKECGLEHRIVEIYWDDFEKYSSILMNHKKAPIHSIEVQIFKASLKAKEDGNDVLIFGENADAIYGGHSNILSQDWTFGAFVDRYSYVLPYIVLKKYHMTTEPMETFVKDGFVDPHEFMSRLYRQESIESYSNAASTAGIALSCPYAETIMAGAIDYQRIRNGENKYLVREVFSRLYPDRTIPPKTPMPRPMNEWLKDWEGPKRPEFWPHCTDSMTGDQKWMVWSLERYLDVENLSSAGDV